MTALLIIIFGAYAAIGLYFATLVGRRASDRDDLLDASASLPGWTMVFAGLGITLASLDLPDHLRLIALYGLQYSHVALGLVLVALAATLVQKRLVLAARLARVRSPVELFGAYYGSVGLRVMLFTLIGIMSVPFAACSMAQFGDLVATATAGLVTRATAIWVSGFFLFLAAAFGGWRGTVYTIAAQSVLLLVLMLGLTVVAALDITPTRGLMQPIPVAAGFVADRIPGVMQYTRGLGKEVALGGPWTTTAIFSFAVSLIGIALSPGFSFFSISTATRTGFAFGQTWMIAALGAGLLLFGGPIFAAGMGGQDGLLALIDRFAALDAVLATLFVVLLATSLQIAVAFYAASGAHIVTLDLVVRFMLPMLRPDERRLALRIVLGALFAAVALLATIGPLPATVLGSVALGLSAQLLPAFLGLCWVPWISRSAVMSGLIIGSLIVVFTEPPGLIAFEELFLDVPWGRWPLTIHAALWGLTFNVAACLLVSIFTRGGAERAHRDILHRALLAEFPARFGGSAARSAKWSLTLIWAFLAIGPGAILGNDFFSHPVFTEGDTTLGVPSLWVWQVVFWFVGVLLVWWLAYPTRLAVLDKAVKHPIDLSGPAKPLGGPRTPVWIALGIDRLTRRPDVPAIGKRHGR